MRMNQGNMNDKKFVHSYSPADSQKQQMIDTEYPNKHNQGKNGKSQVYINKPGGFVSIGRIIPKQISHDKEHLYEENIKLKERLRMLDDQNLKLKTRLTIAEKEKEKVMGIYGTELISGIQYRPGSKSMNRSGVGVKSSIQNRNFAKKAIREAKDEVEILKTENNRIKRSVKYTQITEMQIENERLLQETARLEEYIQYLIENENYDKYEVEIEELKKKLQVERDSAKRLSYELKRKGDTIEDLREKLKQSQLKQVEKERKLSRDISLLRGEIQKQKNWTYEKAAEEQSKNKREKTGSGIKECAKCEKYEQEFNRMKGLLAERNEKISSLEKQLAQKDKKISEYQISVTERVDLDERQSKGKNDGKNSLFMQTEKKKTEGKKQDDANEYDDEFEDRDILALESDQESKKEKPISNHKVDSKKDDDYSDQYNEYDDDFNAALEKDKEKTGSPAKKKKGQEEDEEVLFQKEEKGKKKKKKEGKGKNEKDALVKDTITYKLTAQRYTYTDLTTDIQGSGMDTFTVEELATMLNNEPFYLVDDLLEHVLTYIFGTADLDVNDTLSSKAFLKKMKHFIGEISLLTEEEEEAQLIKIANKISKISEELLSSFKAQSSQQGIIGKKPFMKVLKEKGKLKDPQIEMCVAEASLLSLDLSQINYVDFLKRFDNSQQQL